MRKSFLKFSVKKSPPSLPLIMPISYQEFSKKLAEQLHSLYSPEESQNLIDWLLEHHLGLRKIDVFHFMEEKDIPESIWKDFERLKSGEPIQYILGHGPFYGRDFLVNQHTLIPRNETEELVHMIIKENRGFGLKILDIGTGSGCIPITLKLEMNSPEVYAVDISEDALSIARTNAEKLHAEIYFSKVDILLETPELFPLDIIVSNPPYIPLLGMKQMHKNVLEFEPHIALFVPDEDPLIFYRVIGEKGKNLLKKSGKIYFEIFEEAATDIYRLLEKLGYHQIKIHKDLNGKDRIISAING